MSEPQARKTPLHAMHLSLGARMAPFGGYDMPIQYEGIVAEHAAARTAAAIFDTCHMGEFEIEGPGAAADLERLVTCHVDDLPEGRCRYGLLCNPQGGVIDDLLVYRMAPERFFLVVNAGTQDRDFAWIAGHVSPPAVVRNVSSETAKIDLQGPGSPRIARRLLDAPDDGLRYYDFHENSFRGRHVLVSRTGYTGEIGFEVYGDPITITSLWTDCLSLGATPAGLGARDTLRVEMGLPLYGHELSEDRNAAESGFTRAIARDKRFIGAQAVLDESRRTQALVCMELSDRRSCRQGDEVRAFSGERVGTVTSGTFAPSLNRAIALAYVDLAHSRVGTAVEIRTGRAPLRAVVTERPLYRNATGRRPLSDFF